MDDLPYSTLPEMLRYVCQERPNPTAFNMRRGDSWETLSTEEFYSAVRRLSLALRSLGLNKGDVVALLAPSCTRWCLSDLAVQIAGGVTAPIFVRISSENLRYELQDASAKMIIIIGNEQWKTYKSAGLEVETVLVYGVDDAEGTNIFQLDDLLSQGEKIHGENPQLFEELIDQVKPDDLVTLIYTSGTTGQPKGVELLQSNFVHQVKGSMQIFDFRAGSRSFSVLPLAHVFERMVVYLYMGAGCSIFFADDIRRVGQLYPIVRPEFQAVVPRLLEKVQANIKAKIMQLTGIRGMIGRWGYALAENSGSSFFTQIQRWLADKLLYSKLREAVGGSFTGMISGGAALDKELAEFYWNLKIPVFQGYGLTETSPVIATNFVGQNRVGSVGRAFPDVEIKIGEDDEIMTRGPNVMRGYHGKPEETREVLDEQGWFRTGDKGRIDDDGYLYVTGRIKEMLKTSTGKQVIPAPIESKVVQLRSVDLAMVVAEGKPYVTTLLFPDFPSLETIKGELGMDSLSDVEFLQSREFKDEVETHLREVNKNLNRWEKIRNYCLIPMAVTVKGGELTPTLKIRRQIVEKKYAKEIEQMYVEALDLG